MQSNITTFTGLGLALAISISSLVGSDSAAAQMTRVEDRDAAVSLEVPGPEWAQTKHGQSGVVVNLYSPKLPFPRIGVLRFPAIYLPEGMTTRSKQILATAGVKKVRIEKAKVGAHDGVVFEYAGPPSDIRSMEWGVEAGEFYYVFQIVDRDAAWKDEKTRATYDAVIASIKLMKITPSLAKVKVDPKKPAEVWATRTRSQNEGKYGIDAHDLKLTIDPATKKLRVVDDMTVGIWKDGVAAVVFACNNVTVDEIRSGDRKLEWERLDANRLSIALPDGPKAGSTVNVRFTAHSDEYEFAADQKLVREVAVYGQVRANSCYSSHVYYYPIDRDNDAAMKIAIDVPAEYTAVTGGDLLGVETRAGDGGGERRVFRYETKFRTPRQLPFGFAVGRFEKISGETPGGLAIDLYYLDGKKKEAEQRLAVCAASGGVLESRMGQLPWRRVAFCHVQPFRAGMGVSLPGLVLFSDGYFKDASQVKLTGSSLIGDTDAMGILIFADELSHQWNFYALPLPNEFAEGISTFTNLLYVEKVAGRAEYVEGMKAVAGAYLASAEVYRDIAVADPALYKSPMYRTVAFCKVAAVLHSLRRRLGDEKFFDGWRAAFTKLRGKRGGYAAFIETFSAAAGEDVKPFFDEWLFQAGHPRIKCAWKTIARDGKTVLSIETEQTQPGGLYTVTLPVRIEATDGKTATLQPLTITDRKQTFERPVPAPVKRLIIDPDTDWPVKRLIVVPSR